MRLLAHDHYFAQDIAALGDALEPGDRIEVVSFDVLRSEAMRVLPRRWRRTSSRSPGPSTPRRAPSGRAGCGRCCTSSGSATASTRSSPPRTRSSTYGPRRTRCTSSASRSVRAEGDDDLAVRDARARGGRARPRAADRGSDHRLQRAQPRLLGARGRRARDGARDRSAALRRLRPAPAPALEFGSGGPVVLFFSYMREAYHPKEFVGGAPGWQALHEQTEEGLWELARRGWRVLIKPHPQQPFAEERRRIARAAGPLLDDRVFLVDALHDTRELILGSDVLVGFLTTALSKAWRRASRSSTPAGIPRRTRWPTTSSPSTAGTTCSTS